MLIVDVYRTDAIQNIASMVEGGSGGSRDICMQGNTQTFVCPDKTSEYSAAHPTPPLMTLSTIAGPKIEGTYPSATLLITWDDFSLHKKYLIYI